MTRRMLPVLLSMTLLAAPLVATGAERLPAGAVPGGHAATRPDATTPNDRAAAPADGRVAITRSDGSSGFTRVPEAKDIRRLVGYMRDGIAHADQADREERADDARQTRKVNSRRDKRSRR